jgi:ABC-2 type transport system permease protein
MVTQAIPMNDSTLLEGPRVVVRRRSLLRIHWMEAKAEFLKMARLPAFVVPVLSFPILFYVFFGLAFGNANSVGSVTMAAYLVATYGTFGVVAASLFGVGIGVATERGQGWLQVKRATPMPLSAWFGAKLILAFLFSSIIIAALSAMAILFGGVHLTLGTWLELYAVLALGSIPFCALGLAIGYLAGPNSAPAVVNLIYIPMAFASGLWLPFNFLPSFVQKIGVFLPPYHLAQLALGCIGAGRGSGLMHFVALASFTVLFLLLAAAAYRRDEGKVYG